MSTNARNSVLSSLREALETGAHSGKVPGLPDMKSFSREWGIQYANPLAQFAESLRSVGGQFLFATDLGAARAEIAKQPCMKESRKVISLVPGIGHSTMNISENGDPHELEGLDLAVIPGVFGVAENGAVWVEEDSLPHRALFVVAEHLVIVVKASEIVHNMHEAYARLDFTGRSFGLFISGPSKTADIEQSLVIGAHGARSATVLAIGS